MQDEIIRFFILNERLDQVLGMLEHYTVPEWREFTRDWRIYRSGSIDLRIGICVEALRIRPRIRRIRKARRVLRLPPPSFRRIDFTPKTTVTKPKVDLDGMEITAVLHALPDGALRRAVRALKQSGKL